MMLPYLDQAPLYNQLNFGVTGAPGGSSHEAPNNAIANVRIPGFKCPSDMDYVGSTERGMSNYLVSTGPTVTWTGSQATHQKGMFNSEVIVRTSDVRDGLSNTIAASEGIVGDNNSAVYTTGDLVRGIAFTFTNTYKPTQADLQGYSTACQGGTGNHHSNGHRRWYQALYHSTMFNTANTPNTPMLTCFVCTGCGEGDGAGTFPARSRHVGGVHVLMGDGAVRFVSDNINFNSWQNLGSTRDGETVGEF
jgi:hypothetical protein